MVELLIGLRAEIIQRRVSPAAVIVARPAPRPFKSLSPRKKDPALEPMLLDIVSPHAAGHPMGKRKWLNCRLADIQERLDALGHGISLPVISRLLKEHDL